MAVNTGVRAGVRDDGEGRVSLDQRDRVEERSPYRSGQTHRKHDTALKTVIVDLFRKTNVFHFGNS